MNTATPEQVQNSLQNLLKSAIGNLSFEGPRGVKLFPNGIDLIKISITLGSEKLPVGKLDVTLSGPGHNAGDQFTTQPSSFHSSGTATASFAAPFEELASLSIADQILSFCQSLADNNDVVMHDCNAFVKKVCGNFNVLVVDSNANGIVNSFGSGPWTDLATDHQQAMTKAGPGFMVLAGMTSDQLQPYHPGATNGHVAVVHGSPDANHPGFPLASWGVLGGTGQADQSIRLSFPARACDDDAVHFAYAPLP